MLRYALLLTLLVVAAPAQTPPPAPQPQAQQQVKTYRLPPEKLQKAIAYAAARNRLHFLGFGWQVLALGGILAWRVAPLFREWAQVASRVRIVQAYVFSILLFLTLDVLTLPLSLYGHHLSLQYQQSVQGWGSWFLDWGMGEGLQFALLGVVVWILYAVIQRSPRRWWFYFWLVSIPIVIFVMFIEPVVVEPLFFHFDPLTQKQPALVKEIEKLVARGGLEIPADRMFEMHASEKLNSPNAYVTGIGASKRVVVWDTTLQKMTTGETLFVFGHEMGHYVLGHMWLGIGATFVGLLVSLFAGYHAMRWMLARWGAAWSIGGIADWASLPVLVLVFSVLGFLGEPIASSFSRVLEHNADIYGLEAIHGIVPDSAQTAAQSFQILGELSLSDPNPSPFIKFWLYDHPPVAERVRFAADYNPWTSGHSPKYVK